MSVWYVLNHNHKMFQVCSVPEQVNYEIQELLNRGINKDKIEILSVTDDCIYNVDKFEEQWI